MLRKKQQDIIAKEIDKIEELEHVENMLDIDNLLIQNMGLEMLEIFQSLLDPSETQTIEPFAGSFSKS